MTELESDTYRRGLILGLTMAEIFILVLFLLLLLLLALYAVNSKTKEALQSVKENLEQAQTELAATQNDLEVIRSQLPREIKALERRVASLEEALVIAEEENTIAKALIAGSGEKLETEKEAHEKTQTKLAKTESALEEERERLPDDIQTLRQKINSLEEALANAEEKDTASKEWLENIQQTNDRLRAELYVSKGVDPPCWYEVTDRPGKREKEYFLLDIAVHDEHLLIRLHQAPPGRAIDEQGQSAVTSYAEEYAKLPLEPLATTGKVSLVEFQEIAKPIKRMGKNKQIRDYPCVFYAKIWDFTSATAKRRWQGARGKIENFFYPLLIRNDSWPYTDVAN